MAPGQQTFSQVGQVGALILRFRQTGSKSDGVSVVRDSHYPGSLLNQQSLSLSGAVPRRGVEHRLLPPHGAMALREDVQLARDGEVQGFVQNLGPLPGGEGRACQSDGPERLHRLEGVERGASGRALPKLSFVQSLFTCPGINSSEQVQVRAALVSRFSFLGCWFVLYWVLGTWLVKAVFTFTTWQLHAMSVWIVWQIQSGLQAGPTDTRSSKQQAVRNLRVAI